MYFSNRGTEMFTNIFETQVTSSSAGNQIKKFDNGRYYKFDTIGYEGLAEIVASRLAKQTTLTEYGITEYYPFQQNGKRGCFSYSFNAGDAREVSLYRILISKYNTDLKGVYSVYEQTYDTLVLSFFDFIRELMIELYAYDILPWMTQLLKFDWLILNEDRHFRNIAFLVGDKNVLRPAPLFDNGAAFLSDCLCYPLSSNISTFLNDIKAKPFSSSFETQVRMIEKYAAPKLQFLSRSISIQTSDLVGYYSTKEISRVQELLVYQMAKLYPDVGVEFI